MTKAQGPDDPTDAFSEEELAWAATHLPVLRRWVAGQRFIREALVLVFVLGLAAYVGGYLLRDAATGEPVGLLADLLSTLGTTLWTGVVLVSFVQILPDARRRSAARRLEAYEAALRDLGRLEDGARPGGGGHDTTS